jgi:hypothetical protein
MASAPTLSTPGPVRCPFPERLQSLDRTLEFVIDESAQVLDVLTEVSTRQAADYEIRAAARTLAGAAAELAEHRTCRVESAAVFMPSNMLLYSYVLYLVVPALYVERSRFRPSMQVREQIERLHQLLAPVHGLPVDIRLTSQRDFIADDVKSADLVVFTGQYTNAEQVRRQLRPEQLMLFLGMGVNPFVVTPDADVATAAADLVDIRLFNSGQDCLAPDAVFVHRAIAECFIAELIRDLAGRRFGPYRDATADYGPIHYASAVEETMKYVFRHRYAVAHGGSFDISTMRIDPTVLVRDLTGTQPFTEFFSPVFNVLIYDDEQQLKETLAGAYFSERALGASVYGDGGDVAKYLRKKHIVTYNETLAAIDNGNQPFGGRGRMASYASHRGHLRPEPILVSKAVADYLGVDQ